MYYWKTHISLCHTDKCDTHNYPFDKQTVVWCTLGTSKPSLSHHHLCDAHLGHKKLPCHTDQCAMHLCRNPPVIMTTVWCTILREIIPPCHPYCVMHYCDTHKSLCQTDNWMMHYCGIQIFCYTLTIMWSTFGTYKACLSHWHIAHPVIQTT